MLAPNIGCSCRSQKQITTFPKYILLLVAIAKTNIRNSENRNQNKPTKISQKPETYTKAKLSLPISRYKNFMPWKRSFFCFLLILRSERNQHSNFTSPWFQKFEEKNLWTDLKQISVPIESKSFGFQLIYGASKVASLIFSSYNLQTVISLMHL